MWKLLMLVPGVRTGGKGREKVKCAGLKVRCGREGSGGCARPGGE